MMKRDIFLSVRKVENLVIFLSIWDYAITIIVGNVNMPTSDV